MEEAVIVESLRTPLAKSFRGSLNLTRPDEQLAHCISSVLARPRCDPSTSKTSSPVAATL
jgi:acetyl-CoA acyltransferase